MDTGRFCYTSTLPVELTGVLLYNVDDQPINIKAHLNGGGKLQIRPQNWA